MVVYVGGGKKKKKRLEKWYIKGRERERSFWFETTVQGLPMVVTKERKEREKKKTVSKNHSIYIYNNNEP